MKKWFFVLMSGLLLLSCTGGLMVDSKSVTVTLSDKSKVRIQPVSRQIIRVSAVPEGALFSARPSLMRVTGETPAVPFEYVEEERSVIVKTESLQASVDKITGEVKVEDYVAVCDVGTALNPMLLEGQIEGAILMGIGMALFEHLQLDEKGVVKNASFKKYRMPKAKDLPKITIHFIEEYEEGGPFGAKSIGEASIVPVVPAIVNAVNDALGTELTDLPLLPQKILYAINS